MKIAIILLPVLCQIAYGGLVPDTPCPEVPFVKDLDLKKFMGKWYALESIPFEDKEGKIKCATESFVMAADSDKIVDGVLHYNLIGNDDERQMKFTATFEKPNEGYYVFKTVDEKEQLEYPFQIVDTDYENFALYWTCQKSEAGTFKVATIEARSNSLSKDILDRIYETMDKYSMSRDLMEKIDHANCKQ